MRSLLECRKQGVTQRKCWKRMVNTKVRWRCERVPVTTSPEAWVTKALELKKNRIHDLVVCLGMPRKRTYYELTLKCKDKRNII